MKRSIHRIHNFLRNSGDTLIEVILATTVISAVLIGGYLVAQRSWNGVQSGQEITEINQTLQAQVEMVREIALSQTDTTTGIFRTAPKYFCIDPTTTARVDFDPGFNDAALLSNDFSLYPAACRDLGGRYNIAVTYDPAARTFHLDGRWDRLGGGWNLSELSYRIHPGIAEVQPPVCVTENDIAMVLDSSSSMQTAWDTTTRINKLVDVTRDFIRSSAFNRVQNHGSIIEFNANARTLQPLTGDTALLLDAINRLGSQPDTRYVAGLTEADVRFGSADARASAHKVIIFISDGEPREPLSDVYSRSDSLKAKGYTIHTIAINAGLRAQNIMLQMSGGPGGRFASADSEADLDSIVQGLSDDLQCN